MPQRNIFDETADVIRGFLSLNAAQQALHQYAWQLGTICELIKHTHSIVIEKLEAIEEADSLSKASAVVDELESSALTDSFRANGLCDIFQGFGTSLRKIVTPGSSERSNLPISSQQQYVWLDFCDLLESREREVASLYANRIQELGNLLSRKHAPELSELRNLATQAKNVLTSQLADFDSLAGQFQQLV